MATIAIVSVGITGRLNASFEMGRRLADAGHSVVFASADTRAAERVRAQGYAYFQLDTAVPDRLREAAKRLPAGGLRGFFERRRLKAAIAEARGRAALTGLRIDEFLTVHRPALVLVESELHDTILYLLGKAAGQRMALLEYHVSVRRVKAIPPLSSTWLPAGPLRGLHASVRWRWLLLKRRLRHRWARWYACGWDARSVWVRLARSTGRSLAAVAREDQWPLLYYPSLRCVHLCAHEFDFHGGSDQAGYRVGPMIQRHRAAAGGEADATACRALLARLRAGDRPIVACATGSILTLPAFVRQVVKAADGGHFELVIATGIRSDPAALGELPPNVHAFRYIPQLEVLAVSALFLCHGGIASIHESLVAGVPLLVYSAGCLDENGNAARVEFHGLGLRGSMRADGADDIRARIDAVLGDPRYAAGVARMREALVSYQRDDRFGAAIDELLRESG